MNRRPKLSIAAADVSPEEAAAVVAALERFIRETGWVGADSVPAAPPRNPWLQAALHEGVARSPQPPAPWI